MHRRMGSIMSAGLGWAGRWMVDSLGMAVDYSRTIISGHCLHVSHFYIYAGKRWHHRRNSSFAASASNVNHRTLMSIFISLMSQCIIYYTESIHVVCASYKPYSPKAFWEEQQRYPPYRTSERIRLWTAPPRQLPAPRFHPKHWQRSRKVCTITYSNFGPKVFFALSTHLGNRLGW